MNNETACHCGQVDATVAQSCRPVGSTRKVTQVASSGLVMELDGQPALPQVPSCTNCLFEVRLPGNNMHFVLLTATGRMNAAGYTLASEGASQPRRP